MNIFSKIQLLIHILRWRLRWSRHRLHYRPKKKMSSKFISANEASALIPNNAVVFSTGIAGNARCSIFFYAIKKQFLKTGTPYNLIWINGGAQGGRGKVPGTIEEIGIPGLMKTYITAHLETAKAQLNLAAAGQLELHTLPQGVIALLLEAQGKGEQTLDTSVGLGTFLDPTIGGRTSLTQGAEAELVVRQGEKLSFQLPRIKVTLLSTSYADQEGNLYFKEAATQTENLPAIRAAKKNRGLVMAAVSRIIPKIASEISVPASYVDYIVINPFNEQTVSVPQKKFWLFLAQKENSISSNTAIKRLRFINRVLKITPLRNKADDLMAHLAAAIFIQHAPKKGLVNIGVGHPEEVASVLVKFGYESAYVFTTEAGSYGGLPAPGIFFGAAIHPDHLEPSSTMFNRYKNNLSVAVLGFLQIDSNGHVNVSKRGATLQDYVGPGGFPDIVDAAKTIIFVGNWMHRARYQIKNNKVRLVNPGIPKLVEEVAEITFNGQEALKAGKNVYYVTNVGLFELTRQGVTLTKIFQGIDIDRDILALSKATLNIPPKDSISTIDPSALIANLHH